MEIRNLKMQTFVPDRVDSVPYVSAMTTKDEGKVAVFLVNRNVRKAMRVRIDGVPNGSYQGWTLTAPAIDSNNEAPGGEEVAPRDLPLLRESNSVFAVLPPHSFSVISVANVK